MTLQICSNIATTGVLDGTPAGTWSPTNVARIAKRQLSSWLCMPTILSATIHPINYGHPRPVPPLSRSSSLDSVGSSPIGIHSLPTELLEMVFYHYTHTITSSPHSSPDLEAVRMSSADPFRKCVSVSPDANTNPVTLTHVCARWRTLARLTTKLWCKISVRWPKPRNIPMFATWLQRSGNKPLDLTIIQDSEDVNTRNTLAMRDVFFLILGQSHRWRSLTLSLHADTGPLFRSIFEHQCWARPSILECVSLDLLEDWTAEESHLLYSWLFTSSKLHSLEMGNLRTISDVLWAAPLYAMTSLDLDELALDTLFAVLASCPRLQKLCVCTVSEPMTVQAMEYLLPSLKTLILAQVDVTQPEKLFNHIVTPSLTKLSLPAGLGCTSKVSEAWVSLASFLQRSSCNLIAFEVSAPNEQEQDLVDLITSPCFSQIEELTIASQVTDVMMIALTAPPGSFPSLPKLSSIWLKEYNGRESVFSQMLLSRVGVLQRVYAVLHPALKRDFSLSIPNMTLDLET